MDPTAPTPDPDVLALLDGATTRLVRGVDGLPDPSYDERSLLPGWSRGHVVAHLALHAEGLAEALGAIAEGRTGALYPSQAARDGGVIDLAAEGPSVLRERLFAGCRTLTEALEALESLPPDRWSGGVERVPGSGVAFTVAEAPFVRLREVEIHHADLGVAYSAQDWSPEFAERAVDSMRARAGEVTLLATDLGRTWHAAPASVTVAGPAALLAWWLSGRGQGEGLTSNGGVVPRIEEW